MHPTHAISTTLLILTGLASACGGGVIQAETTLPPPADNSSGVIVNVPDGSSVCERVQILVYQGAPPSDTRAIPADRKPIVKAGGFGTYSKASPRCTMVANVEPGDYWVIVNLPESSYSNGGWPSLPGSGSHPKIWRAGKYPVTVTKGQTAKFDLRLEPYL